MASADGSLFFTDPFYKRPSWELSKACLPSRVEAA